MQINNSKVAALVSIYELSMKKNNGQYLQFADLKNKKILVVNTASDCGYTFQYDGLQKLYEQYKEILEIIAFPSNDFGDQEKGDDEKISEFCRINFGVTFPLMAKSTVIKGADQNHVFKWLTHKEENGWNNKAPLWNFSKYLIDERGNLTHVFETAIEPSDPDLLQAIRS